MKFVLYVEYRYGYQPMFSEYFPMEAQTIEDAIIEAVAKYNSDIMYLIRIMKKVGRSELVERGGRAPCYEVVYSLVQSRD